MKFLVVGLKKGKTFKRLYEEAAKRGHSLRGCLTSELTILSSPTSFVPSLKGDSFVSYDLIYLCAGIEEKRRFEWYLATRYLYSYKKVKIVNEGIIDFSYQPEQTFFYLKQFEEKINFPKTITFFSPSSLNYIEKEISYPMIIKISGVHRGEGIVLVKNRNEALAFLRANRGKVFLARQFISNDGDIRVFCIGYKAIGAMKRIPPKGDFRSNISVGGKGIALKMEEYPEVIRIAERASLLFKIEIAGVDIMIDKETGEKYILEINVGPQFLGLEKYTGINVAKAIVEYFEKKVKGVSRNEKRN